MHGMIQGFLTAEQNNKMLALGYKYKVEGDFAITSGTDPWSGMPNTTSNTHFFTDKAEAEAYAAKQTWVFNEDIHGTVVEMKHEETRAEWDARYQREEAEKKAKKAAREATNAAALGITVEEYKKYKKDKSILKKLPAEIAECEAEIQRLQEAIKRKQGYLTELTKRVESIENGAV